MSLVFTPDEIEAASAPNVARSIFVEIEMPEGPLYLHNGISRVFLDGKEWLGLTDPFGGRLVGVEGLEQPYPGQAAAVTLTLSGADRNFVIYLRSIARQIEGNECNIYWCMFDERTGEAISELRGVFLRGVISAPTFKHEGISTRTISITVENIWASMNFAGGRRWNDADQQRFYPGDKGLQYAGVKILEVLK